MTYRVGPKVGIAPYLIIILGLCKCHVHCVVDHHGNGLVGLVHMP